MRLVLFVTLFLFIFVGTAFARSGCCSGHGGVDCSAGAQSDGTVICNDGWTGSSCDYAEMVECGGYSNSQPTQSTPQQSAQSTATPIPTQEPVYTTVPTNIPTITSYLPPKPKDTPRPKPTSPPTHIMLSNTKPTKAHDKPRYTNSTTSYNPLSPWWNLIISLLF